MLRTLDHGWLGLLAAYCLAALGLYFGVRRDRPAIHRFRQIFVAALPVMLGAAIGWSILREASLNVWNALGDNVTALFGMGFITTTGLVTGKVLSRRRDTEIHKRGTVLTDGAPQSTPASRAVESLTLASQQVPPSDETKHFKMMGTTGTGKSTAIRELLTAALARGDRAIIADPFGSYLERYYDPARGDLILNPFDTRAARWDLFAEIMQPHDADEIARSLIPDYEGADRNWRNYARTFLTAVLRQLHRAQEQDLANLYWLLLLAPVEDLRDLLAATPAAPFLGSDNGKFFESVRSVAGVHVAALEHVARQTTGDPMSVRTWAREGRGVLFLPYQANEITVLRHLISSWMRLAIFQTLDSKGGDQKLWFVVDELEALGAIDGLKDALARLRKFGGRCVLGFQSIAQVRGAYGDAEAQTIVENCGNTLILRCSASERGGTAEFASRLIGKREIIRKQAAHSRPTRIGGSLHEVRTTSDQHTTEDAVLASEIEQLPDFTGFLKLASRPEWWRVVLQKS
jgi:type IV secretion system coupling TraD/TrwB family protein